MHLFELCAIGWAQFAFQATQISLSLSDSLTLSLSLSPFPFAILMKNN